MSSRSTPSSRRISVRPARAVSPIDRSRCAVAGGSSGAVSLAVDAGALQPSRTARHHLLWLAHSQGLGVRRVDEVIGLTGLATATRRKAGGYSLGMRQRLGIAAALLGDPPVLMLDEPFNGLDPEGIVWMRGFLRALAAEGRAVLVSSHLMSELQDAADHLVVVGRGRVVADTSVDDLITSASGDRVTLRTGARSGAMTVLANAGPPSPPPAGTSSPWPGCPRRGS
ncbi:MAG TPA: ATP-binding cassette domain-containing protein [Streptosporangiaceae bacterium]|nr:ATP-binding cassette domain-containing protein [Streptosporangiaceae bacterium]